MVLNSTLQVSLQMSLQMPLQMPLRVPQRVLHYLQEPADACYLEAREHQRHRRPVPLCVRTADVRSHAYATIRACPQGWSEMQAGRRVMK